VTAPILEILDQCWYPRERSARSVPVVDELGDGNRVVKRLLGEDVQLRVHYS
jgi:hypothetical protein